jgi:uncharacterized protein (DUF433 family)
MFGVFAASFGVRLRSGGTGHALNPTYQAAIKTAPSFFKGEDRTMLVESVGFAVIERDSEKLSGVPVFAGTRVPLQNLFDCLEAGESLDAFLDQFPTVTRHQAIAALELSRQALFAAHEAVA